MKIAGRMIPLLALVLVLSVLLSSCDLSLKSIDDLMRPPLKEGEKELQKSITNLLQNGAALVSPERGDYHSAITLHDLNSDGEDEAVVFYSSAESSSAVHLALFVRTSEKDWNIIYDSVGNGNGVYGLNFLDLNGDGFDEILVNWYMFDMSANRSLTVYGCSFSDSTIKVSAIATESCSEMRHFNSAYSPSILLMLVSTDLIKVQSKAVAKFIKVEDDYSITVLSELKLDSRITSVGSIRMDITGDNAMPTFFIDANIGESSMITEVLDYNEKTSSYESLFYDNQTQINSVTQRSDNLPSRDIDNDGNTEIPGRYALPDDLAGYVIEWHRVKNGELKVLKKGYANTDENYVVYDFLNNEELVPQETDGSWSFYSSDKKELFSIVLLKNSEIEGGSFSFTEVLAVSGDYSYVCIITDDGAEAGIKPDDLINNFELMT